MTPTNRRIRWVRPGRSARHTSAGRRRAVAIVVALALVVLVAVLLTTSDLGGGDAGRGSQINGPRHGSAFRWFVPAPVPAPWRHLRLPAGGGVLSFPPLLHPVTADHGAVSAALVTPDGSYLAYLNATPLQGDEHLNSWAVFRVQHLREDNARSARAESSATMLHFRGGTGSCVIDDYVTQVGSHHFHEIACLVEGDRTGSVVVAAAPPAEWPRVASILERAVAGYSLR